MIDFFYNRIGLAELDQERYWLFGLHKNALLVMKYVNLEKANAQHIQNESKRSANTVKNRQ